MTKFKRTLSILASAAFLMQASAFAVSYDGAVTVSSSVTESGKAYSSTAANQNALLVTGGTSVISDASVTKTGSPTDRSDDYDFYGTNAAVLVNSGASLTLTGGSVTTDASYGNAVYANGTGVIDITGTVIKTSSNNSGGIMVTGGGTLNAKNVTVTTSGGSAAAIRSDKGGGTVNVTGGSFTTSGSGSPAVYSTADITVTDAELTSGSAEGIVIEGGNSVTLNNVTLTDTNLTLNGQSETYKNIFLYQSMSGDASSGGGSFTAADSTIITNKGDSFFVTNNKANIVLTNNTFINNDPEGYFLRAQAGAWGTSGSNGGSVTLTLDAQAVTGDIYIDGISALTMILKNGASFTGTVNGGNTAKSIEVQLSSDSKMTLTGDSYVYSIENEDASGSNIDTGSYTLTTGAGEQGGAAAASVSGGNATGFGGQTPPDMPGGNSAMPGGSTPPDKPDGDSSMPGGSTPPDKPDGDSSMPGGSTPPDMPGGDGTMPQNGFADVGTDAWYYDAVGYVSKNGLMNGGGDGKFEPDGAFTRIQLMTVLARADGENIEGSDRMSAAVAWALENDISDGTSPEDNITREQFVTMLYRYAIKKGYDTDGSTAALDSFTDSASVSGWAIAPMRWAVEAGLVKGDNNALSPSKPTERSEAAAILMRFCENTQK